MGLKKLIAYICGCDKEVIAIKMQLSEAMQEIASLMISNKEQVKLTAEKDMEINCLREALQRKTDKIDALNNTIRTLKSTLVVKEKISKEKPKQKKPKCTMPKTGGK